MLALCCFCLLWGHFSAESVAPGGPPAGEPGWWPPPPGPPPPPQPSVGVDDEFVHRMLDEQR
eukprot:9859510-Lingulodinium_polyedra.AAC.1